VGLYRDTAVVLRTHKLAEADRIVVLFTKEHGKVRAVAKGVRKTKSRIGGRLEPLTHAALLVYEGRGELQTISQADAMEHFRPIRDDLQLLTRGLSLLEVVDQVTHEGQADERLFDKIVNLCKRRGFVFPSAEIYGGFRSTYDYGPLGVLLLRNVKDAWWRSMVQLRTTWSASTPPSSRRPPCGRRRATWPTSPTRSSTARVQERFRLDKLDDPDTCPNCGAKDSFTEARQFNLMFKTHAGPVEEAGRRGLPAARDGPGHVRQLRTC
jgi:hypothetical protein